ncbi:MAG: hypothetical protein SchgKO_11100 [Schleiferiaceae bacterium]
MNKTEKRKLIILAALAAVCILNWLVFTQILDFWNPRIHLLWVPFALFCIAVPLYTAEYFMDRLAKRLGEKSDQKQDSVDNPNG